MVPRGSGSTFLVCYFTTYLRDPANGYFGSI